MIEVFDYGDEEAAVPLLSLIQYDAFQQSAGL